MSASDVDQAWTKFYIEYGRAMLAWALIESELATLFSFLTRISPDMAVQIFYSPRSFKGRTDIFKSALNACKVSEEIKIFARSIIRKSDQYSDCRNSFAHDQPLLHQTSFPAIFEVLMVDAKAQFQKDEIKKRYIDNSLSAEAIADIGTQFMALANLIRDSWAEAQSNQSPSLDKLRERLDALPTLPRPKVQPQPPAKPPRQRRP